MVHKRSLLAAWPWEFLGTYKYWVCAPLVGKVLHSYYNGKLAPNDWWLHVLIISFLRCCLYECWHFVSRAMSLTKRLQISTESVEFEQVDREFDWDNYILLQACILAAAAQTGFFYGLSDLPSWDFKGVVLLLIVHIGPVECIYYVLHRVLHGSVLFVHYHSLHHSSSRVEPSSAGTSTFLEHLLMMALMGIPLTFMYMSGTASLAAFYMYILGYDFLKFMIHSNVEVVPLWPFWLLPPLKYLLITPSYHAAHHTGIKANFCLFLPLYDYFGGTLDSSVYRRHEELRTKGQKIRVPDIVFLVHGVDFLSALHIGFFSRTFSSVPFKAAWYSWLFWPFTWNGLFLSWFFKVPYQISSYSFRGIYQETWTVPRYGFEFLLPFRHKTINQIIERAILDADRSGVKVIALGALNKNEAMNGGGSLFVKKYEDLRVRVCHGNTLTTAVILKELPDDTTEVFLTGATSKIGKAIALYLCRRHVQVLMLTASKERFNAIVSEAALECQKYLVQVQSYESGKNCKIWIVGKWAGYKDQRWAPPGTHFHQFTMPEIFHFRKDCTYGALAGLCLPSDVKGLSTCEYKMRRCTIHACHAGGLVHCLEGWKEHEVGSIDVDKIDIAWDCAMKYGLRPNINLKYHQRCQ